MENTKHEILVINKLSYFYPEIYSLILDDCDIGELKEGSIVKYRNGQRKCLVTNISTKEIIIDDMTNSGIYKRNIKKEHIHEILQLVKYVKPMDKWEGCIINSYHELKHNDYIIDAKNNIFRVESIYTKHLAEIFEEPENEGRICAKDVNNELIYIMPNEIKKYKKVSNLIFI